ncbi:serine hydrolase domain-containing protein [Azospirillum griseum]|uniref:Class A beta-lactamase-related serine hydrolase n=1 Tax=Azospirillum griseum TaxID=2496639 RepID=A0A431VAQ0_9PROT|nr:serine hydrolase domain-containing protein [Azospirillum griseum]RTR14258.1 class A beta-lactamase-related serine hydrolase [Azospirillum griseum]
MPLPCSVSRAPILALIGGAVACVGGAMAQTPAPDPAPPSHAVTQAQFDEALAAQLRRYGAPGGVLLVSGPDGPPQIAAAGVAELPKASASKPRPVRPDTRFHIASTGKMMTAVAVLQLVEEGKLSLDSPVMPLIGLPGAARLPHLATATVGDLLSQRSGIPDCLRNAKTPVPRHPSPRWTVEEALTKSPCGTPTTPGQYAYSNTNFLLLGRIIEKLDRRPLAESLNARIFRPAGMTATTLGAALSEVNLAHGYQAAVKKGRPRVDSSAYAYSSPLGDAPVTTTITDLDRFMSALFRQPGRLLRPETLAAMVEDRAGEENDEGYGFGLVVEDSDWGKKLGHPGRLGGFRCEAWHYPEVNRTILLILNGDENGRDDVGLRLAHALLPPPPAPPPDTLPTENIPIPEK